MLSAARSRSAPSGEKPIIEDECCTGLDVFAVLNSASLTESYAVLSVQAAAVVVNTNTIRQKVLFVPFNKSLLFVKASPIAQAALDIWSTPSVCSRPDLCDRITMPVNHVITVSVVDHRADDAEMIADTAFECLDVYAFVVTVDATPLRLLNHNRVEPIASYA